MARTAPSSEAAAERRSAARPGDGQAREPAGALADSGFLAVLVLLSCVPYTTGLGLYSDDWAFLSALAEAPASFAGYVAALMPIEMATRPVQALEIAALYAWFGTDPTGYHVVNALVLAAAVVFFHLSLRALRFPRVLAILVPLVFGLLPHYSTDRVWIAAFQANASVCLLFLSLWADLRFISAAGARGWPWKVLGSIALLGSVLAYEVTAALLLANVLVLGWHAGVLRPARWSRADVPIGLAIASNVVLLAGATAYKLGTTVRADIGGGYRYRVLRILREAVPVHFGDLGVELPIRLAQILRSDPSPAVLVTGALIGLAAGAYVLHILRGRADALSRVRWAAVVLLGIVLFGLGYAVTLTTWEIGFHPTGANNRTAIGAAIGVSFVFVGVLGWLATLPRRERARPIAAAALAGLLAATASVVTGTVATHWVGAAREQDRVIAAIRDRFPDLPPGSTLLIDGLCPYVGPAPVFATGWDTSGMLHLEYGTRDLRGDVLKPNSEATPAGVRTLLFDDVVNVYPYGDDLHVLHIATGQALRLTGEDAARRYLETVSAAGRPPCPPYTDGDGAAVF